ncbi:MAG TPA: MaoC family dehydratase [Dehalococcoidia bacterium]|nr:MaoC family dehydratase [Dehalococcoidia bacterium]
MATEFDPRTHRMLEPKFFEDLAVGEKYYINSRTLGESHFLAFQAASGDNHPIHYDIEYCRARGMPNLLAHGFQALIQTAPGAGIFPHVIGDALVGFIEQSSRFLKPLYAGDTVYPLLEIVDLIPQRTTGVVVIRSTIHNQRGELILEGEQRYLVRKRNPAQQ